MKLTLALLSCGALLMMYAPKASADDYEIDLDPAVFLTGAGCPNGWCASSSIAVEDPENGDATTLAYTLTSLFSTVTSGDVDLTGIGVLLRFETSPSTNGGLPTLFVYTDNAGFTTAPSYVATLPTNVGTVETVSSGTVYLAYSGDPGYDSTAGGYLLGSHGDYYVNYTVELPEPTSILLLGTLMFIVTLVIRKSGQSHSKSA